MKTIYFLMIIAIGTAACTDRPQRNNIMDDTTATQTGQGVLLGSIVRSPACAVETRDRPCPPKPAAGTKLTVATVQGKPVMLVTADANGHFRANLKPGTYRIKLSEQDAQGPVFSKDLPATVDIDSGRETRLNVVLDSGIR